MGALGSHDSSAYAPPVRTPSSKRYLPNGVGDVGSGVVVPFSPVDDDKQAHSAIAERHKIAFGHVFLVLACLLPILYVMYAFLRMPVRYVELIAEDNIGETFTATCFLGAGMIALLMAYRRRREAKPWMILALFGLAALFIGGEEMSWFSRLLGYKVEILQRANAQREVNFHNLTFSGQRFTPLIAALFMLFYGLLLPLAAQLSTSFEAIARRWAVPIPPLHSIPLFLVAAIFLSMELKLFPVNPEKIGEIGEMMFGLGILVTAATFGFPSGPKTSLRGVQAMSLALMAALMLVQFGPSGYSTQQRERRLTEFRDWRYFRLSLADQARELIEYDRDRQRYAGLFGNSDSASYNRLLLSYGSSDSETRMLAAQAERYIWADLALASINASIALGHLDKKEEARQRLGEAKQFLYKQLAASPERADLLALWGTVICLEEGPRPAVDFLNSKKTRQALDEFRRTKVLQFINQRHCGH